MTDQREYWSQIAHAYDRVVDLQLGPATRSMVRDRVAKEGWLGNLVELGCGTGFYTEVLLEKADSVVATDLASGMLGLARDRVKAANVSFQAEDCQKTSFPNAVFDTAFISLVLHFTAPDRTIAEMHRIVKAGGTLIIVNLDPRALHGLDRIRCLIRIIYHGLTGYRVKPPRGFGRNMMTEHELCGRLLQSGFEVASSETIRDRSRSSNMPVEYVRAVKL